MTTNRSPRPVDLSQQTYPDPYAASAVVESPGPSLLAGLRTGTWLDQQEFPELRYAIPGIFPEGLTVLAGPPKVGKSWLSLHVGLSVSAGTEAFDCLDPGPARPVLYLALEDGWRRLQSRARSLLRDGEKIPDDLEMQLEIEPNMGLETVAEWMERASHEKPVVLIDTLAKVMPKAHSGESAYERDYRAIGRFKQLADAIPGSSIICVHHTRKMAAEDFVDGVSGTAGITGAADTTVVLSRQRSDEEGVLKVTGRDVWEAEYLVQKSDRGLWHLVGGSLDRAREAAAARQVKAGVGDRSGEIIDAITDPAGIGPKDLAEKIGMDAKELSVYLGRLHRSGRIEKLGRGRYAPTNQQTNTPNGANRGLRLVGPDSPVGSVGTVGLPGQDDDED